MRRSLSERYEEAMKQMETFLGMLIPFLGTTLGAACVFFMKKSLGDLVQRALAGFAAGVMVAASIWSLLIPSIEQSEGMGKLSFLPAFIGFWVGALFLLLLDHLIPHLHVGSEQAEGPKSKLGRTTMMVLAVTLHNIPEGMAVGVVYAGLLAGNTQITAASALVLSLGIAIQNFPEGAIISMPLRAEGESKGRAFFGGVLSGVVEPIGAVLTLWKVPYFHRRSSNSSLEKSISRRSRMRRLSKSSMLTSLPSGDCPSPGAPAGRPAAGRCPSAGAVRSP